MWRVAYVDDEPDLREIAKFALEQDPQIEVRTFENRHGILGALSSWMPDLVLLDVMMPGMDGPTTLGHIRQGPQAGLPVVFITAKVLASQSDWLTTLGAQGIIAKPFDPLTLSARVREYLPDGRGQS